MEPPSRPKRGYLPPAQYTKTMFEKEVQAFQSLQPLHGSIIPMLYGHYHIEHAEREYAKDRIVYACLFEFVEGVPLSPSIISSLTDDEATHLWDKIQSSMSSIHKGGVIRRNRLLRKVLWYRESSKVTWTDFSQSAVVEDMSVDDNRRQRFRPCYPIQQA